MSYVINEDPWLKFNIFVARKVASTWGGAYNFFESEIKFILKLQIDQILTMSKSDLSGV